MHNQRASKIEMQPQRLPYTSKLFQQQSVEPINFVVDRSKEVNQPHPQTFCCSRCVVDVAVAIVAVAAAAAVVLLLLSPVAAVVAYRFCCCFFGCVVASAVVAVDVAVAPARAGNGAPVLVVLLVMRLLAALNGEASARIRLRRGQWASRRPVNILQSIF